MSESLCVLSGGEIRTAPLGALLVEALRSRATGELRVDARGGTSRVYFRNGQPCGAQIFFGFKPLGQFLLEQGWIDIEALNRSLAAVVDGKRQGEALVELGYLSREQLLQGLALHHQTHIRTLASLTEGVYTFSQRTELPRWTDELHLSAHRAILDALGQPPGTVLCEKILARVPAGLGIRLRRGWEKFESHFRFEPAERVFVSGLETPISVEQALAGDELPAARALAVLATLFHTGILIPAPLGTEPLTGPWATPGPFSTPGPQPRKPVATPGPKPTEQTAEAAALRQRMLQRAIGAIPGAEALRRTPSGGSVRHQAPAGPGGTTRPPPSPGDVDFETLVDQKLSILASGDHFQRLGVSRQAGRDEIKQAFFAAAKRFHPDRLPREAAHIAPKVQNLFAALNESYQVLMDDAARQSHRLDLEQSGGPARSELEILEVQIRQAFQRRDYPGAQGLLAQALRHEDRADFHALRIWARFAGAPDGEAEKTRIALEVLLTSHPACVPALHYRGVLARMSGDIQTAENCFRAVLSLSPSHREAGQELRLIELRRGARPQRSG